jgi:hypothetical protein
MDRRATGKIRLKGGCGHDWPRERVDSLDSEGQETTLVAPPVLYAEFNLLQACTRLSPPRQWLLSIVLLLEMSAARSAGWSFGSGGPMDHRLHAKGFTYKGYGTRVPRGSGQVNGVVVH